MRDIMMQRNHALVIAVIIFIVAASIYLSLQQQPADKANDQPDGQHNGAKAREGMPMAAHAGVVGNYSTSDFDPSVYLTTWNFNDLPPKEREKYYKETPLPDGTLIREYWFSAQDKKIEVAPGVFYDAWVYNGQAPGPTVRATDGDTIRIYFKNDGSKPHTIHFHGLHPAGMDGSFPDQFVNPGENFTYEFKAEPAGLHLYHCHSTPLKDHIAHGLYGAYIVDPKGSRAPAHELVMVLNSFDTNFDEENEIYAANTKAFYYMNNPIKVKKGELVRIYAVNIVEFDQINSLHIHGNFFNEYRTGTMPEPNAYTDIIELGQGERSVLELRFNETGLFMFHAHQTEFTEKGWMGAFDVQDAELPGQIENLSSQEVEE